MAGVAISNGWAGRHRGCGQSSEFGARLEPVGPRIIEGRAVEADRARNVSIGFGGRRLFLAVEERRRPRIDQRRTSVAFDSLDLARIDEQGLVESRREDPWRGPGGAGLERVVL